MAKAIERDSSRLGWAGFLLAAFVFLAALVVFWAGPFAPQQQVGISLGQIASDIGKSALRGMAGLEQPAAKSVPLDLDDYLRLGIAVLGGVAVILGITALIKHEKKRPAIAAIALAGLTVTFQFFVWYAIAFLGVLLIWALLENFGEVFRAIFES